MRPIDAIARFQQFYDGFSQAWIDRVEEIYVTHLRFDDAGRVTHHRDLFDAAEGFYETLPVIGAMLRAIKRRI